jgi:hypothetical protein
MSWVLILWMTAQSGAMTYIDFATEGDCKFAIEEMKSIAGSSRPWAACVPRGEYEQEQK